MRPQLEKACAGAQWGLVSGDGKHNGKDGNTSPGSLDSTFR